MRTPKWYRSIKRVTRPFRHRLWYGAARMRGGRHLCKSAERRLWKALGDQPRYERWQPFFEPVRGMGRVGRTNVRPVPFWSNKRG